MKVRKVVLGLTILFGILLAMQYFLSGYLYEVYHMLDQLYGMNDNTKLVVALVYYVLYTLIIMVGLPLVAPLSIIGGRLFGLTSGIFLGLASVVSGSILMLLMMRRYAALYFDYKTTQEISALRAKIKRYGPFYLLALHVMFIVPLLFINGIAFLENIAMSTFLLITSLGALPSVAFYVYIGHVNALRNMVHCDLIWILLLCIVCVMVSVGIGYFSKKRSL